MDAVLFDVKRSHLASARFERRLLRVRESELTPARFDLLHALSDAPMRQCDLWRMLGIVRSVASETLRTLRELGWVKRVRAADSRTWLISMTKLGRELFWKAYEACIASGDVTAATDAALLDGVDDDGSADAARSGTIDRLVKIRHAFGWVARNPYWLDPEDFYCLLRYAEEGERFELVMAP